MAEAYRTAKRAIAAAEVLLIAPAGLFMAALFFRNLLPGDSPANGAQQVVMWYASRNWTLWGLLIGLPVAVLVIGVVVLLHSWNSDEALRKTAAQTLIAVRRQLATLLTAGATLAAGVILGVVVLHMVAN